MCGRTTIVYTPITAWYLHILITSLVTHCCGMECKISISICERQPDWLWWSLWDEQHTRVDASSVQWGRDQSFVQAVPSSPFPILRCSLQLTLLYEGEPEIWRIDFGPYSLTHSVWLKNCKGLEDVPLCEPEIVVPPVALHDIWLRISGLVAAAQSHSTDSTDVKL